MFGTKELGVDLDGLHYWPDGPAVRGPVAEPVTAPLLLRFRRGRTGRAASVTDTDLPGRLLTALSGSLSRLHPLPLRSTGIAQD